MGYIPHLQISDEAHRKLRELNADRSETISALAAKLLEAKIDQAHQKMKGGT